MSSLLVKKISKSFAGTQALKNISLSFEAGRISSLVGPNGSGKTTLINIISGIEPWEHGSIVISENVFDMIKSQDALAYGITRTFQNIRIFEQISVLDNILVVLTERNIFSALFETHATFHEHSAKKILERVGLWECRDKYASQLSFGQRKLLEVGRALATHANIYLFDEPFAGLFPEMRECVSGILLELRSEGKTIILVDHNMDIIRKLSDYVFVMNAGEVLSEGPPEKVLAEKNVMEAYLGE